MKTDNDYYKELFEKQNEFHTRNRSVLPRHYTVDIDKGHDGYYYARINSYTLTKHEDLERLKLNSGHHINQMHLRLGLPEIKMSQIQFNLRT